MSEDVHDSNNAPERPQTGADADPICEDCGHPKSKHHLTNRDRMIRIGLTVDNMSPIMVLLGLKYNVADEVMSHPFDSPFSQFLADLVLTGAELGYQKAYLKGYNDGLDAARKIVHEEFERHVPGVGEKSDTAAPVL